jgi:hypothetical protein
VGFASAAETRQKRSILWDTEKYLFNKGLKTWKKRVSK